MGKDGVSRVSLLDDEETIKKELYKNNAPKAFQILFGKNHRLGVFLDINYYKFVHFDILSIK